MEKSRVCISYLYRNAKLKLLNWNPHYSKKKDFPSLLIYQQLCLLLSCLIGFIAIQTYVTNRLANFSRSLGTAATLWNAISWRRLQLTDLVLSSVSTCWRPPSPALSSSVATSPSSHRFTPAAGWQCALGKCGKGAQVQSSLPYNYFLKIWWTSCDWKIYFNFWVS